MKGDYLYVPMERLQVLSKTCTTGAMTKEDTGARAYSLAYYTAVAVELVLCLC